MSATPIDSNPSADPADAVGDAGGHAPPAQCENCHAPLQGEFCHDCGQSIHNPVRHAGHALEEVFESFWHLDGRLWRTLRDLMVPGRTATEYLAGHRQRYMPPLRLFVVMSLLAFFVGRLSIHFDDKPVQSSVDVAPILQAQSVEEVERVRDRMLADLDQGRKAAGDKLPGVDAAMIRAQVKIQAEASNRIVELSPDKATGAATAERRPHGELITIDNQAWDPEQSPIRIGWLPDFANAWLTHKAVQARENIQRMENRPDRWFQTLMTSLPSALFVLVPVFALLLKAAYLFKRRLYLEHMVVALYSHVFLLIALTAVFALMALSNWLGTHALWASTMSNACIVLLLVWMPLYLLLMQKRVYGQGWPMTLLKYAVVGFVYFYLLATVAALMFLVALAKG